MVKSAIQIHLFFSLTTGGSSQRTGERALIKTVFANLAPYSSLRTQKQLDGSYRRKGSCW